MRRDHYLCLDYAVNWANNYALGLIEMAFALNAGGWVNNIQDAVALGDGFSRTFGKACAASDAIFFNFHCHGFVLLCEIVLLN